MYMHTAGIQGSIYALHIYFSIQNLLAPCWNSVMETGAVHFYLVTFLNTERNSKTSRVSSGDTSDNLDFYMWKGSLHKAPAEEYSSASWEWCSTGKALPLLEGNLGSPLLH